MGELKTRVDELKMENDYQLRLKDMNYSDKIKELTEKFIQEMESLKTKNQAKPQIIPRMQVGILLHRINSVKGCMLLLEITVTR